MKEVTGAEVIRLSLTQAVNWSLVYSGPKGRMAHPEGAKMRTSRCSCRLVAPRSEPRISDIEETEHAMLQRFRYARITAGLSAATTR